MSAANHGETDRAILALQATVKDLSARLAIAESRLDALENPESPLDRGRRGLAELQDKIDKDNPDRVPGNSVAELSRQRLTDVD